MAFKNDPLMSNKPRNYDVKIIGGKRVLIWKDEEPKAKRKNTEAPPLPGRDSGAPGRPPSSDSMESTYSTLPPIGARGPGQGDLDRFVSQQVAGVEPAALDRLLAALVRRDVGRERGLLPAAVAEALAAPGLPALGPVLPALLDRFPHYYYYTGTPSGRVSYELLVAYLQQRRADRSALDTGDSSNPPSVQPGASGGWEGGEGGASGDAKDTRHRRQAADPMRPAPSAIYSKGWNTLVTMVTVAAGPGYRPPAPRTASHKFPTRGPGPGPGPHSAG
jgi:hypothetical protein